MLTNNMCMWQERTAAVKLTIILSIWSATEMESGGQSPSYSSLDLNGAGSGSAHSLRLR